MAGKSAVVVAAEMELLAAALAFASAKRGYHAACDVEPGFHDHDAAGERTWTDEKATPAWTAAWQASFDARGALERACLALADAIEDRPTKSKKIAESR